MIRAFRQQSGLTLVELVAVVAVTTVLTLLLHQTFRFQQHTYTRERSQAATQQDLRTWISRMVGDLRRAGYDPLATGNFGFLEHQPQRVRFTVDANENGVVDSGGGEELGYKVENGTLHRWVGGADWRPVIHDVGDLGFVYRDAQGNLVTSSSPGSAIKEIEIVATAKADIGFPSSKNQDDALSLELSRAEHVYLRNPG